MGRTDGLPPEADRLNPAEFTLVELHSRGAIPTYDSGTRPPLY